MPAHPVAAFLVKVFHPGLGALYGASQTFSPARVVEALRSHLLDFRINTPIAELAAADLLVLLDEDTGVLLAEVSWLSPETEGLSPTTPQVPGEALLRLVSSAIC